MQQRASLAFWLVAISYFVWLAGEGLTQHFAADDMMNMARYQTRGLPQVLADNILFFRTEAYRPLGGIFYLTIYKLFHLNPLPYRIVCFLLLLLNLPLIFRFTKQLTGSTEAAMISVLIGCFHANLIAVYYYNSLIYDILASVFFLAALTATIKIREQLKSPTWPQIAWILTLALCAMNGKEIAATLPIFLIAYELLFQKTRHWKTTASVAVLTAIYATGKLAGDGSLASTTSYHPTLGIHEILRAHASYLESIFYRPEPSINAAWVFGLWTALAATALTLKNRVLAFALLWIVIAPMPTAIIGRGGGPGLYLPLTGWAMLIAYALTRIPPNKARTAILATALLLVVNQTAKARRDAMPLIYSGQENTWAVLEKLRLTNPTFKPTDKVLVVNDPFDTYDSIFILRLWSGIPELNVTLEHKAETPVNPTKFDQIIDLK